MADYLYRYFNIEWKDTIFPNGTAATSRELESMVADYKEQRGEIIGKGVYLCSTNIYL